MMSTPSPFPHARGLAAIAGTTLIAPSIKVLYTPTTKVACSTIKLMLAQAEGTHRPELIEKLITANISRSQTIHNPVISGLTRLIDLPEREAQRILHDPEWVRIAALRDPLARSYSAWENRIFMRAPGKTDRAIELCQDVVVDGRIDMAGSFALFAKMIAEYTDDFTIDHHFLPQCHVVRTDIIDYNVLIRVDVPGEMKKIEDVLSERSGKVITASRLNEGTGIKVHEVCDVHSANRLMAVYHMDYDAFGFERKSYPAEVAPHLLSPTETQLVHLLRNSVERLQGISVAAQMRIGIRYGLRQIRKSLMRRLTFGRMYNNRRKIYW
jgi:hypothetical protein